jgi:hypothetical protein
MDKLTETLFIKKKDDDVKDRPRKVTVELTSWLLLSLLVID